MVRPMTHPDERPNVPMPTSPQDDLDFEIETERMSDGRQIHYYQWREPATVPTETPADDV